MTTRSRFPPLTSRLTFNRCPALNPRPTFRQRISTFSRHLLTSCSSLTRRHNQPLTHRRYLILLGRRRTPTLNPRI